MGKALNISGQVFYKYNLGSNWGLLMKGKYIFDRKDIDELVKELTFSNGVVMSVQLFIALIETLEMNEASFENKVSAYHTAWRDSISTMYEEELPKQKNRYNIGIELTPYTVFTAEKNIFDLYGLFKLSNNDKKYCEYIYDNYISEYMTIEEYEIKMNFVLCILIMPPLLAIGDFYVRAYNEHIKKAELILGTVQNNVVEMPQYRCNIGLGLSNNFITQEIYRKYGEMNGLIDNPIFLDIKEQLLEIKNECGESKVLSQNAICPYCGQPHDIVVHKNDIFFAHLLLLHKDTQAKLGLKIMSDYKEMYAATYFDAIKDWDKQLNHVEDPKCYILVEGDTEEKAIPYMAVKYGKPLAYRGIKVWNSKTKEKVYMDFEKMIKNNPDAKVCVLLDGDAKKQIDNIERIIQGRKNQYALHYIPEGTFEDLIDKDIAITALNTIYGESAFDKSDFVEGKSFLNQVEKKIHMNSEFGKFDKIQFIEIVMKLSNKENIPNVIKEIIDDCYKFVDS